MAEKTEEPKKKDFAAEVRKFFGMPEPGQEKGLTAEELIEKHKEAAGKTPTKAGPPKKKKKPGICWPYLEKSSATIWGVISNTLFSPKASWRVGIKILASWGWL